MLRSLSILNLEEVDDAELLKDLRSLGKPLSFDGRDTMLVNTAVDTRETFIRESSAVLQRVWTNTTEHIEMPQIQYTDKVADKSVAVQRQVSPITTETKAPEHVRAVAGKYQWDDRPGGDAEKDVRGEAITKYCWSEGKKTVSICKQRIFRLIDLAREITGVKVAQKTWHKLLDERQLETESSHIASTKEIVEDDTAKTANSKVQKSIKGLNDKHSKFEIEQGNVTDTPQCVISTIDHRQTRGRCGNESAF